MTIILDLLISGDRTCFIFSLFLEVGEGRGRLLGDCTANSGMDHYITLDG